MSAKPFILLAVLAVASCRPACSLASIKTFDAHPGTNTLTTARDAVRAWRATGHPMEQVFIRLMPGEYQLTETLKLEAQDNHVLWLTGDPTNTCITGGQHLNGLTRDADGYWRGRTDLRFEQLFVNGRRAMRARLPESGFYPVENAKQENLPEGRARLTLQAPAAVFAALPKDAESLCAAQLLVFHNWDTSRYRIEVVDEAARTISVIGKPMQPWNPWNKQSRFLIDNVRAATPLPPGSWFLAPDGHFEYAPLPDEATAKLDFVVPRLERLMEVRGACDIDFCGLCFRYTKYDLPPEGCPPAQAASQIGAAIEMEHSRGILFEDCEISGTGNYALWFRRGCQNSALTRNFLTDLGAGGLRIGEMDISDNPADQTGHIQAGNSVIRGCGRIHPSAVGVWIGQSASNHITSFDISDTFYTAISVGWTWGYGRSLATNNWIAFNNIHHIGQGVLSDMGGIYMLGVAPGSVCEQNSIFDVRAHDYGGWGIYPDEGSTGWQIASNVVWDCTCVHPPGGGAFHQHYGATNHIVNNIFALSSGPPMQATRVEDHLSFTLERNLIISSNTPFFSGPWDKMQVASHSNLFVAFAPPEKLFPNGDLTAWQKVGHESGSMLLTNITLSGNWPHITLSESVITNVFGFHGANGVSGGGDDWQSRVRKVLAPPSTVWFGD